MKQFTPRKLRFIERHVFKTSTELYANILPAEDKGYTVDRDWKWGFWPFTIVWYMDLYLPEDK